MRRGSKKKREIYFRTMASHRQQPGYQEIWQERARLETEGSEIISKIRSEKNSTYLKLANSSTLVSMSLRFSTFSTPPYAFADRYFPLVFIFSLFLSLPIYTLVGRELFIAILLLIAAPAVFYYVAHPLSKKLLNLLMRKHQFALEVFDRRIERTESAIAEIIEDTFRKRCDLFAGYPPDWGDRRSAALSRDNHRCQTCGSQKNLHIHHITPLSSGGTNLIINLTTLCKQCHRLEHGQQ